MTGKYDRGGRDPNMGQGLPANVKPARTCQHTSGCDEPVWKASYCEAHYRRCYTKVPMRTGKVFR